MNKAPEDYENGVAEFMQEQSNGSYPHLRPLGERGMSVVNLRSGDGKSDDELEKDRGFSSLLMLIFRQTQTMYGYLRDGKIEDEHEVIALRRANNLNDFIFDAECLNREARWDEEEERAKRWQAQFGATSEKLEELMQQWSEADAFMLQAEIYQTQHGVEAALHLHAEFLDMQKQRSDAEMEAPKLRPAEYQYFWCRVRQYKIMRERARDLALGYPTHDFKKVKQKLAEGGNIHHLVSEMAWPWRESYHLVMSSLADGHSWREMMMSMFAQEMPRYQQPPQYGPPPQWNGYNGNGQQPPDEEGDGQQDKRKPVVLFGGGNRRQEPEPKPNKKRRRRRRRTEHR